MNWACVLNLKRCSCLINGADAVKRRPPHIASRWDTACGLSLAFPHRVNPPPPTPSYPLPLRINNSWFLLLSLIPVSFKYCSFSCFPALLFLPPMSSPSPIFTFKAPQLRSRPPRGGFSPLHALERLRRRGKECARAVDPPDIHSLHLRVPGGWQKRREKSNNQHQHANRLTSPGPRGTCMHFNYWSSHMIKKQNENMILIKLSDLSNHRSPWHFNSIGWPTERIKQKNTLIHVFSNVPSFSCSYWIFN